MLMTAAGPHTTATGDGSGDPGGSYRPHMIYPLTAAERFTPVDPRVKGLGQASVKQMSAAAGQVSARESFGS